MCGASPWPGYLAGVGSLRCCGDPALPNAGFLRFNPTQRGHVAESDAYAAAYAAFEVARCALINAQWREYTFSKLEAKWAASAPLAASQP